MRIEYAAIYEAEHDSGDSKRTVKMSLRRSSIEELRDAVNETKARMKPRFLRVVELHRITASTEVLDVALLTGEKA